MRSTSCPSTRRRRSSSESASRKASVPEPSRRSANKPPTRTRKRFETSSAAPTSCSSPRAWAAGPGPAPRNTSPASRKRKAPSRWASSRCPSNPEAALDKLRKFSDTTIVIYNDKLLELVPRLPINAAFKVADEILMQSIKGMTEIITKPGLVNLDYADLMTIMKGGGVAMIGIGESEEERDRIDYAINEALESPLLGEVDLTHARGALVRVVGGPDLSVSEAEKAVEIIGTKINPQARIIWGCSVEHDLERTVHVLLVITGVKSKSLLGKEIYTGPVKTSAEVDEVR